jgi:hypothetical protein
LRKKKWILTSLCPWEQKKESAQNHTNNQNKTEGESPENCKDCFLEVTAWRNYNNKRKGGTVTTGICGWGFRENQSFRDSAHKNTPSALASNFFLRVDELFDLSSLRPWACRRTRAEGSDTAFQVNKNYKLQKHKTSE